jgi:hypothetical protein
MKIPNDHETHNIFHSNAFKIVQSWYFWHDNVPSGNPGPLAQAGKDETQRFTVTKAGRF